MTNEAVWVRTRQIAIVINAQTLLAGQIAVACIVLSLSAILWAVWYDINQVPSEAEFFAYSWIYGIRWGAGETIFAPHSQLLFPIYAVLNKLFVSSSDPASVFHQWKLVSQYWPAFLVTLSLGLIYSTTDRKFPLTDVAFTSLIYVVSVPLFIDQIDLFSMSYHSLSVPLALGALWFWKAYESDRYRVLPVRFFLCLGLYTALCALGKPTFAVFASPFFAMETAKAILTRSWMVAARVAASGVVAVATYLIYLVVFYGSARGFFSHFLLSRSFMLSQYHWYDQAKGATPFDWYFGYVIGVMGRLPTLLMAGSLAFSCLRPPRTILLSGVVTSYGLAMYVLYHRSQLHGHPEYIALLATTTIGTFRCSGLMDLAPVAWVIDRIETRVGVMATTIAIGLIFLSAFPLATPQRSFMEKMAKYDDVILPALFQHPQTIQTIAMNRYPDVFLGTADAWCRGEGNIFDIARSTVFDDRFGNTICELNQETPGRDLSKYSRLIFPKKADRTQADTESAFREGFPHIVDRMKDCRPIEGALPDQSTLIECDLTNHNAR
jgi:hypothetical protein